MWTPACEIRHSFLRRGMVYDTLEKKESTSCASLCTTGFITPEHDMTPSGLQLKSRDL